MDYQIAPRARQLLIWQFFAGVALASVLLPWKLEAAYSALVGASVGFLPNVYFALRVFDMSKGRDAQSTLGALYRGATAKFIVTAALFCVAFLLISPLHVPALFIGFIAVQLVNWLALAT